MLGMSCANCALRIENTVGKLSGVTAVTVSVMTNRAKVAVDETINNYVGTRDIIDKVVSMGYTCQVESINGVMMNGRGMNSGSGSGGGRDDTQNGSSNELKAWYWPLSILTSQRQVKYHHRHHHYHQHHNHHHCIMIILIIITIIIIIIIIIVS